MKLYIEAELDNEAMQSLVEVKNAIENALMRQASDPLTEHQSGTIRDYNGNSVGSWAVRPS